MSAYLENPQWAAQYRYAMGPPNGGFYKRWIQGSVGMMDGMPLYSNEYSHLYMKHGQNNLLAYRGGIKYFSPRVTNELHNQVERCSDKTINPVGCQNAAVNEVLAAESYARHQRMQTPPIPPNVHYQY